MDFQEIKASLLADNNKALTHIYMEYGEYCTKKLFLLHKCSTEEADGLFIEAVMIFRRKILDENIAEVKNVGNYIYRICENLFLARLKVERSRKKKLSDIEFFYYSSNYLTPEEDTRESDLTEASNHAWQQLNEKCKDIIYYFYVDKLRMDKIAELMGFASGDVAKTTKARCYKQLVKLANDFYTKLMNKRDGE